MVYIHNLEFQNTCLSLFHREKRRRPSSPQLVMCRRKPPTTRRLTSRTPHRPFPNGRIRRRHLILQPRPQTPITTLNNLNNINKHPIFPHTLTNRLQNISSILPIHPTQTQEIKTHKRRQHPPPNERVRSASRTLRLPLRRWQKGSLPSKHRQTHGSNPSIKRRPSPETRRNAR